MISGLTVGVRVEAWKRMRAPMKSVVCQRLRKMQVMNSWHGVVRRNTRTLDKRVPKFRGLRVSCVLVSQRGPLTELWRCRLSH